MSYEEEKERREEKAKEVIKKMEKNEMVYSHSSFTSFMRSPQDFINYKVMPRTTSPQMEMGTLTHLLILEPGEFKDTYFVISDKIRANSTEWLKRRAEAGGRDLIKQSFYDKARWKRDAVLNDSAASSILEQCDTFEEKNEWDYDGVPFIGYIDAKGPNIIADLKVTDSNPDKLKWKIRYNKYQPAEGEYGRQGAHYTYGTGNHRCNYFIIAVNDKLTVSVIEVTEDTREHHYGTILWHIEQLKECIKENRLREGYSYYSKTADGIYRI